MYGIPWVLNARGNEGEGEERDCGQQRAGKQSAQGAGKGRAVGKNGEQKETDGQVISILLCGNRGVFDGALTQLISMTNRSRAVLQIYLMTMDLTGVREDFLPITEEQTAFLGRVVEEKSPGSRVERLDVTEIYAREFGGCVNERAYCTPYTLLRLLADLVPNIPDKLLYLDIDMMFAGDVRQLWNIDVSEYEYAAVKEKYGCWLIRPDYINAGMLLLNMKRIRQTGLLAAAREKIRTRRLLFADQSALFLATTRKRLIPRIYNEQSKFDRKGTIVCHFCKRLMLLPYPHTENYKQWQIEEIHRYLHCHTFDADLEEYLARRQEARGREQKVPGGGEQR